MDILFENRIFHNVILGIAQLDEFQRRHQWSRDIGSCSVAVVFADLLQEVHSCIHVFYQTYEKLTEDAPKQKEFRNPGQQTVIGSAVSYARAWGTSNFEAPQQKFLSLAYAFRAEFQVTKIHILKGNRIEFVFTNGFYFPSMPQIRPLLFGIKSDYTPDSFRSCSKKYS